MSAETAIDRPNSQLAGRAPRNKRLGGGNLGAWFLVLAVAALAIPTLITLAQNIWSTDTGAEGPLVLITAAWLIWRVYADLNRSATPGVPVVVAVGLGLSLTAYIIGRAFDFVTAEAGGLYASILVIAYSKFGLPALRQNWFPFLYLGIAVPPPSYLLDGLTRPLKGFVSELATTLLATCGLPVAHEGVTIYVAQYQLLVEDACSGMNSIIGITASALLYVYLMRGSSPWYSILLLACALPIAIAANVIRIMILILLTYFGGDELAQGFLHMTTGLFLFAVALGLVFALDSVLRRTLTRLGRLL